MLAEKPLTKQQKWDAYKAAQRAERLERKGGGRGHTSPREGRRRSRRGGGRSRLTRGQSRPVDRVVFNINTGQREPMPRPVVEVTE